VVLAYAFVKNPLRHVIVIVGENHSFDNLFGAYLPDPKSGQSVTNLLSQGTINSDGTPVPRFRKAQQWQAIAEDKDIVVQGDYQGGEQRVSEIERRLRALAVKMRGARR